MRDPMIIPDPIGLPQVGGWAGRDYLEEEMDIIGLSIIVALLTSVAFGCMGINERDERRACQYEEVDE